MKKFILLSLFVIISLFIISCGNENPFNGQETNLVGQALSSPGVYKYLVGETDYIGEIKVELRRINYYGIQLCIYADQHGCRYYSDGDYVIIGSETYIVSEESGIVTLSIDFDALCGNGNLDFYEQCDDGNNINGDGCNNLCQNEDNGPICGDGVRDTTSEQCDDGNILDGDGCSSLCLIEAGSAFCGNGIVNPDREQCDDGNNIDGDGCQSNCAFVYECGDGIHDIYNEVCEDGNLENGDGCDDSCNQEPGWNCYSSSSCERINNPVVIEFIMDGDEDLPQISSGGSTYEYDLIVKFGESDEDNYFDGFLSTGRRGQGVVDQVSLSSYGNVRSIFMPRNNLDDGDVNVVSYASGHPRLYDGTFLSRHPRQNAHIRANLIYTGLCRVPYQIIVDASIDNTPMMIELPRDRISEFIVSSPGSFSNFRSGPVRSGDTFILPDGAIITAGYALEYDFNEDETYERWNYRFNIMCS